jgi:hypothetical protein
MAIQNFSKLLQDKVYKEWLEQLDKNIVTSTVDTLRSSQQIAKKTSFYITADTVSNIIKTITGTTIDPFEIDAILEEIRKPDITNNKKSTGQIAGTYIDVNGQKAVYFDTIGFDTISTKLNKIFNDIPEISLAYQLAEEDFIEKEVNTLKNSAEYKALPPNKKQEYINKITEEGKRRATLGYYFNKGHVISIAANLAKQFKDEINKTDKFAQKQKDLLIKVLDEYINKLVADDLASANLPNAIEQELYARYVKSSDKYLVELQLSTKNIASGRASIAVVEELRNIFGTKAEANLINILQNSPALGQSLLRDKGSPSMLELIEQDLVSSINSGKRTSKKYTAPRVKIGKNEVKLKKPKKNTTTIAKAKRLVSKLKSSKPNPNKFKEKLLIPLEANLTNLQNLLNANLVQRIKQNMGEGNRRDILNLRTGRFAESVKVERLSQSREGMISAFYSYMRNPYATFSDGGRQEIPRSRNPKLLISKSIRELAAEQAITRLRAVLV